MITAQELRLKNVLTHGDTVVYVDAIFPTHFICETEEGISRGNSLQANFTPIPLSPEILEKCGFKIGGYDFLFWDNGKIELAGLNWADADIPEYQFVNFRYSDNGIVSIYYLHQLQNLYYSLTGEELIFKQ